MNWIDLFIPTFLAFREGLEAVLVVIIILLYLKKTDQKQYYKFVFLGIISSIISSIFFALFFFLLYGEFTGIIENIFEGLLFILSGILIVSLILWISIEGPKMKESMENKIERTIESKKMYTITSMTFLLIMREGVELVLILLGASSVGNLDQQTVVLGSILGLFCSFLLGLLIFFGVKTINLSKFFKITNFILIFFATGLILYGIHEFIEGGIINPLIEEVWNISSILPENFPDTNPRTPIYLEIIGSLLKVLFGYNAKPSLLEVILYPTVLMIISLISLKLWKRYNPNKD